MTSSTAPEPSTNLAQPRLLAPKDTRNDGRISWFDRGPVPPPLREQAVRRLGLMALATIGMCFAFWLLIFFSIRHEVPTRMIRYYNGRPIQFIMPMLCLPLIVASVWLYRLTRNPARDRRRLLNLGAGYQVLVALVLSFAHHLHGWEGAWVYSGWSYAAFMLVGFATIVPSTPGRNLLVSALCVACDVFAFAVTIWAGAPQPPTPVMAMLLVPDFFAAGFAYFVALVVHGLGRQIERAEGMGSYQLVERLGRGSMGEVWRAEHRTLARPAAIKLIRPEALGGHDDPISLVTRFEREAQATALLCSPNTIRLYDYGQSQDGSFYYVMELLDGVDLEHFVRRFGPLPPARAVHLLRQACHSLAEAHTRGFVHRDIKPANILLCRYGLDVDHIKVVDFGIVKPMQGNLLQGAENTHQGHISGTPNYLAPEQARGSEHIDGRADLYALGCVAFWLLTGRRVFDQPTALAQIIAHASQAPARLSDFVTVPDALEAVVQKCLAKQPEDRYPDAHALEAALAAVPFPQPWSPEDAKTFWSEKLPDLTARAA